MRFLHVKHPSFQKVTSNFQPSEHRLIASLPLPAALQTSENSYPHILCLTLSAPTSLEVLAAALAAWSAHIPWLRLTPTPRWQGICLHSSLAPRLEKWPAQPTLSALTASWREPLPHEASWKIYLEEGTPSRLYLLAEGRLFDPISLSLWLEDLLAILQGQATKPAPLFDPKEVLTLWKSSLAPQSQKTSELKPQLMSWRWSEGAQQQIKLWPVDATASYAALVQSLLLLGGEDATLLTTPLPEFSLEAGASQGTRTYPHPPDGLSLSYRALAQKIKTLALEAPQLASPAAQLSVFSPEHRASAAIEVLAGRFSAAPLPLHFILHAQADALQYVSWIDPKWSRESIRHRLAWLDALLVHSSEDRALAQLSLPESARGMHDDTFRPYALTQSLPELLAAHWPQDGERIAVESLAGELNYRTLDAISRQVACLIHASGLGPGDLIGLALPRTPLMLASLLGVWRAGAAYVPLDPAFPEERLGYMVQDAQIKALFATPDLLKLCPEGAHAWSSEDLPSLLARQDTNGWQDRKVPSNSLAYVIYTSGSTGQPKGVMLSHRSVVNFLLSMREKPGMKDSDRMLAVTTLSFDIAVLELLLPLLVGARLYIADAEELRDGKRLRSILETRAITHFQATPSMYRLLLDGGWRGSHLRQALCGGEAFPADVARLLVPLVDAVWNMYGPTETTVWSSVYRLQGDEIQVPIGRPIANTQIYILDSELQELPPGRKGEIYIGGEGLALGYLGRPDLTAERFVQGSPSAPLLYRTGDIGRRRWDGSLEIFGRVDQQIKLRGYRMELGEIEAHVSHVEGIAHCVAAVHNFGADDDRLVAYVTIEGAWDEKKLRSEMKKRLPSYMLPQLYVRLAHFPTLPNGKIDRKQLPHPLSLTLAPEVKLDAPATLSPPPPAKSSLHALVPKRSETQAIPLTPSQARMLYVEQLSPGTRVHNLSAAWRIRGPLDVSVLREALRSLLIEQEAFRLALGEGMELHLLPPHAIELPLMIYEPLALPEIEQKIAELSRQKLDISRAPHAQMGLFPELRGDTIFFLLTHHIFWDGFSYGVFWRQLQRHYREISATGRAQIKLPALSFAQYARMRQAELDEPAIKEQLAYWRQRFQPLPDPLELACDRPRPSLMQHEAASVPIPWDLDTEARLRALMSSSGATLYHTLLTASFCLLSRLSGQVDLVIGTPLHGRQQSELFELLGNFINIAALRLRIEEGSSFVDLLKEVKKITQEAQAHADLPFESLVASLTLPRDTSRTPLYSAMVFYQDLSLQEIVLGTAPVEPLTLATQTVDSDLVFSFERHPHSMQAYLQYRSDLWDEDTAQAMAQSFHSLLVHALKAPHSPIVNLGLLDSGQQQAVLAAGRNATPLEPTPATLDRWIFAQAHSRATHIAVEGLMGPSLTYGELSCGALRLANYLQQKGVRPGQVVGVCLPREPVLLVVLTAILRLGAAYLPLDPSFPPARLQYMARDAAAALVVTEMEFIDLFSDLELVCLDRERKLIAAASESSAQLPETRASDVAYLIYTSGSTGQPKGVAITQGAVVHFLQAIRTALQLPEGLRTLALTTISFDISVLEIFGTLVWGGTVVLVPSQLVNDGPLLVDALRSHRIDLLQATPASWRLLLSTSWTHKVIALCGGEAMSPDLGRELLPRVGRLWNVYGPTEATVWATAAPIEDVEKGISLGRVLPGYEALILDAQGHLLPFGAMGRLHLAGPALARGYHARPELTAERFPLHPYAPDRRMYDTGDLARLRRDGQLEYGGRRDHQVKLRGFRIELGEIETLMQEHPAIVQAACLLREDHPGEQKLVAYARLQESAQIELQELQTFLQGRLPRYMLPQQLVILSVFPLSGSGKIDRKQLPQPQQMPLAPSEASKSPALSENEQRLAKIFGELLGLTEIRGQDMFFDLGGHSLMALRLMHRCQEELGLSLRVRDLLLLNLSQLAAKLDSQEDHLTLRTREGA